MPAFEYRLRSRVWLYPGAAGWHFVTLPRKQSKEIKTLFAKAHRGWGSLPVIATVGKTSWKTSIFADTRSGAYLLPIKADVRRKEQIGLDQLVHFTIQIRP